MKAIWTKNNRRTKKKIERQKPKQINNEKKKFGLKKKT